MRLTLTLLALLGALVVIAPPRAGAHANDADSVDCTVPFDCEIRWEDHTRFDDARRFAVSQWHRLGRVDIVPDSPAAIADLRFIDYRDCGVSWEAFWGPRAGADVVGFNPCTITKRVKGASPPDPRAVAVHEVGHALRLAHPSGNRHSPFWLRRSIMYGCARCTPSSTYLAHDVSDYRRTW